MLLVDLRRLVDLLRVLPIVVVGIEDGLDVVLENKGKRMSEKEK